jgi:hypothetical protein
MGMGVGFLRGKVAVAFQHSAVSTQQSARKHVWLKEYIFVGMVRVRTHLGTNRKIRNDKIKMLVFWNLCDGDYLHNWPLDP